MNRLLTPHHPEILVIGSVAWDEVVPVIGPLSIGAHHQGREREERIGGGAANTALALARAGAKAVVISAVGPDPSGARLVASLAAQGVVVSRITRDGGVTTRSLVLPDDGGERTIVNLSRAAVTLPSDFAEIPAACCYVRGKDPRWAPALARRYRKSTVIVHVPPLAQDRFPAQVLVGSASDLPADFLADPWAGGWRVAGPVLEWVVITRGPRGAIAYGNGARHEVKAPKVSVMDTTGAGDVFAAGLVFALARGRGMTSALATAVRWGSASVGCRGTVFPEGWKWDSD